MEAGWRSRLQAARVDGSSPTRHRHRNRPEATTPWLGLARACGAETRPRPPHRRARGLDKASEGYADRAGVSARDREVVDRMTAYQIPDQDVEEFMREGGLGEYAK